MAALFNYAVRYYDLRDNPCRKAGSIGKSKADEMDFGTKQEFKEFLPSMDSKPEARMAFLLLYWTGMRIGELLALTYEDIDLEKRCITRNMFYDEQGKHRRTKKEILDEQGNIRAGCSIISKGEVYESHIFTKKEEWFKDKSFTKEVKELFTDTINCYVKEESEKLSVFQQGGVYLATKKIGKNNPKAEEIKADNAARQEWNRTVDVALVEGVPEKDILKIKQEKITDKTLQSIRKHGWLPDMFRQIIRGAKDFLQEVIFKFKLPSKPVPKIDLQEWKDMQKVMYELQRQSMEIKRTQQDISSLKKQLLELRGFFKGKERKSLEGRIELLEDLEKRLHRSMEQIVKREGYPKPLLPTML